MKKKVAALGPDSVKSWMRTLFESAMGEKYQRCAKKSTKKSTMGSREAFPSLALAAGKGVGGAAAGSRASEGHHVDPEALARELKVLVEWEYLEGEH